jgi:hypothetical protein
MIEQANQPQQERDLPTLLACPFCGGAAQRVVYFTGVPDPEAEGIAGAICQNADCMLVGYHWPEERWNRRPMNDRKEP